MRAAAAQAQGGAQGAGIPCVYVEGGAVERELQMMRQVSAGSSSGSSSDLGAGGSALKWSEPDDDLLTRLVAVHGTKRWNIIAQHLPGRTGKQVRLA